MKYCVVIIDGAAGHPLPQRGCQTTLELAQTPNLNVLAAEGLIGLTSTVPAGMEPSSAIACMSIVGYDPKVYYKGRSVIEALSMGINVGPDENTFRCNLVAVKDGKMWDYSAGHITTEEAKELIGAVQAKLGNDSTHFYPGVAYRHILKFKGQAEAVEAQCTAPHDISGQAIAPHLPKGKGSEILNDLMRRSEPVLREHPVNKARIARGETPATTIWLFWPSGQLPTLPSFQQVYGVNGVMISAVDLLRGIAQMAKMDILKVPGVTDGPDNDYVAQAEAGLEALKTHDLVVVHIEAPDEAGHSGSIEQKITAIEKTDREVISRLRQYKGDQLRILVMPDHPTPIELKTHTNEPVPFLLWGPGFKSNAARRLTEAEAAKTGFFVKAGYGIINKLINPQA
jgi:2,3-bisphosphoglycerate-independent phosphoglycerate mutase